MTMPAGKYWIGDLCYVMRDRWDEFCDLTIGADQMLEGEFTLKDGTKVAAFCTKWGDGCYQDQHGNSYGVDAGLIGCIRLEDINAEEHTDHDIRLGHVFDFTSPFEVSGIDHRSRYDGVISFGRKVVIDTDPEPEYEDEEYE